MLNISTISDLNAFLAMDRAVAERQPEGEALEYKAAFEDDFGKHVAAFANNHGGTIIVGVATDAKHKERPASIPGVRRDKEPALAVANRLSDVEPRPRFTVASIDVDPTQVVLVINVASGPDYPYVWRGRVPVRIGAESRDTSRSTILSLVQRGTPPPAPTGKLIPHHFAIFEPPDQWVGHRVYVGLAPVCPRALRTLSFDDESRFEQRISALAPLLFGPKLKPLYGRAQYDFTMEATGPVRYPRWWLEADGSVYAGLTIRPPDKDVWSGADVLRVSALVIEVAMSWLGERLTPLDLVDVVLQVEPQTLSFTPESHVGGARLPVETFDPKPVGERFAEMRRSPPDPMVAERWPVVFERQQVMHALAVVWLRALRSLHGASADVAAITAFLGQARAEGAP